MSAKLLLDKDRILVHKLVEIFTQVDTMRRFIITVVASLFLTLVSAFLSAPAVLASSTPIILFSNVTNGSYTMYSIHPDGTGLKMIGAGIDPRLSPDGAKILYLGLSSYPACGDGARLDIYTMNIDGSHVTNLTQGTQCYPTRPTWSSDGTKIAFEDDWQQSIIYVMNADGSNSTGLIVGTDPSWSPDGTKIAFSAPDGLKTINPDGSGLTLILQLSPNDFYPRRPAWSPDSTTLAYSLVSGIYKVPASGGELTLICGCFAGSVDWGLINTINSWFAHFTRQVPRLRLH